ncbi:MAG: class I SAM-dependent rRNA methyltransferase [Duncaniella sp.]|uniref:class I SAM-dependent rRNA methyltransferase n=1 Tax=Duncaniella sp. TaxID=2518496 RepID=UPI0019C0E65F|nr:class I SAM-dependent rRNA methyltransferase [Duncaniella sp.]MBD5313573.1 class I SAM-dependent rRNA methyltransferase [Bacteroides sp.]MBD5335125.1 class I SAM-dependent rRNA methyltransferase [Bacteroides sp.]MBD5335224.1 class I SAM-dependent rRNA methyltransferase [Bacteroides sp.]MDE6090248.1 class I SAM-dependent rRNA methyltransferase [Duncaniella sp.]
MSSKLKTITLKRGKEESLLRFHPWVFSGAIAHLPEGLEEGETVRVEAADGRPLGVGHYEIGSIAVRLLDPTEREIDASFYAERLAQAWALRQRLGLIRPDNTTFRLVHGEGDFLPGCVVDIYGDTAVLQAHSPGMHFARNIIAEELTRLPGAGIKNVYYKSETTLPFKARLDPVNDYIVGGFDTNIAIENGLKFNIDWLKGQKTGFFVDQRDNRALIQKFSQGARVLNMFCYTGGFSVYAMRGGAELVHSVDSSAKAITLTDANIELNFPGDERHKSYAEDAFKFLARMEKGAYDLIVLDPPAFAKHRSAIRNAMIGYRRLNAAAFEKIAPGGILFTFSCSQAISKEQFRLAVFTAAAMSGRRVRILHQLTQPADHPVNIYHPEGEYLKGLVLYVE